MLLLLACSPPPPPAACVQMRAPAAGPLASEIAPLTDGLEIAKMRLKEAQRTGDPGFYTLAETALDCALIQHPGDTETRQLKTYVLLQYHRFAEAEELQKAVIGPKAAWMDWMLYGDALMEQGKLEGAGEAYQHALDQRPGLLLYDRVGWLRWLWGDRQGAEESATLAVSAATPEDPENYAWVQTRLGWLHALQGRPALELDLALAVLPDYPPARYARGRIRLARQDFQGAVDDLVVVGPTVEATRALADAVAGLSEDAPRREELRQQADVEKVKKQDPRGYAIWLVDKDPKAALGLLEEELKNRQDAMTHLGHAYAASAAGQDASAEAKAALATGILEPRALLLGGLVLKDPRLQVQALTMGPGLLPSERQKVLSALESAK